MNLLLKRGDTVVVPAKGWFRRDKMYTVNGTYERDGERWLVVHRYLWHSKEYLNEHCHHIKESDCLPVELGLID